MAQSKYTLNPTEMLSHSPELQQLMYSEEFKKCDFMLPIVLGTDDNGIPIIADLTKIPHLLIGGSANHQAYIQTLITPLMIKRHSNELNLIFIEDNLTNDTEAIKIIESLREEMYQRYQLITESKSTTFADYNTEAELNGNSRLSYIVLIISDFSLIIKSNPKFENSIAMLAQLARAVGIHIIMATCSCSENVFSGIIKANFPARIALHTDEKDTEMITDNCNIGCIEDDRLAYINGDKWIMLNEIKFNDATV